MNKQELINTVMDLFEETGIEGGYGSVSCSTAGDYPSLGIQQLEGNRADELLDCIDTEGKFMGRAYSDIEESNELEELSDLIGSEKGIEAQRIILARDVDDYIDSVMSEGLYDDRCIVFCASWCPTSISCVCRCILKANISNININDIEEIYDYFYDHYAYIADCVEYEEGYHNRCDRAFNYVVNNIKCIME